MRATGGAPRAPGQSMTRAIQRSPRSATAPTDRLTDLSDACDLLSNERRCLVLEQVYGRREPLAFRELVVRVTAAETGKPPEALSYDERKRVRNSLAQHHLRRLAAEGVVEYDRSRGMVAPGPRLAPLARTLRRITDDTRWATHYHRLTALAVSVLLALWADMPLLGALSDRTWATLIVAGYAGLALLQARPVGWFDGRFPRRR